MHTLLIILLGIITAISGSLSFLLITALGIGAAQLVYVIPVSVWLKQKREWGLMKGVIIGGVLTTFLNLGCWLLVIVLFF